MEMDAILADHSARIKVLEESSRTVLAKLDTISSQLATVIAHLGSVHTPENCPGMRETRRLLDAMQRDIDALYTRANDLALKFAAAQGSVNTGGSVAKWVFGIVASIILILISAYIGHAVR